MLAYLRHAPLSESSFGAWSGSFVHSVHSTSGYLLGCLRHPCTNGIFRQPLSKKKPLPDRLAAAFLRQQGEACCSQNLFAGNTVNGHFAVVVQFAGGIAIAVKADVATLGAFCIKETAMIGLHPDFVRTGTETAAVVVVSVVDRGDAGLELRVIGDLHIHVEVNNAVLVVVPSKDVIVSFKLFCRSEVNSSMWRRHRWIRL